MSERSTIGQIVGADSQREPKLDGRMSVLGLTLSVLAFAAPIAVVSGMIPFTIFFLGASAPVAFALATVALLIFSVGYTTMARFVPKPGAFYAYITTGLGKPMGLASSFVAFIGYFALAVGTYQFFGITANSLVINTFHGPNIKWYWYAFGILVIVGILGVLNIDLSARIIGFAMIAEVAVVVAFDVVVLSDGGPEGRSLDSFRPDLITTGSVGVAVLFAATAFLGFEATAIYRDEVRDPVKTVPRATFFAVASIGLLYTVTAWAVITAFGVSAAPGAAATDAVSMFGMATIKFMGTVGYDVATVLLLTSVAAALIAVQNILSRYVQSLGIDGVLPIAFGRVHPRYKSPHVGSSLVTTSAGLLLLIMTIVGVDPAASYVRLGGLGGFSLLFLMFLTSISVVVYFKRNRFERTNNWNTTIAPCLSTALLGIILYLALSNFQLLSGGSATVALILQGIFWVVFLSGILFAFYLRNRRADVYRNIGRSNG